MQRDMDLVRSILLYVEASEENLGGITNIEIEGYSSAQIRHHVVLMEQAGLIDASITNLMDGVIYIVRNLTWGGHEFLDAARNESFWNQAKAKVLETTGGLGFEALKAFLLQLGTGS